MLSQRRRLKHQTCTLITAAVLLLGGSCAVWQPESGTSLSDTMTPIVFAGFVPAPSTLVRLEARNTATASWVQFATATSDATPYVTDSKGVSYYVWQVEAAMPDGWPYWPQIEAFNFQSNQGTARARVRAMAGDVQLPTLPLGGVACAASAYGQTGDGEAAIAACKRSVPEVDVPAPCGNYAKNCCTFAPTCRAGASCEWFDAPNNVTKCTPDYLPTLNNYLYPSDRNLVENLQGVTHDDASWYFVAETSIKKVPVAQDLKTLTWSGASSPFPGWGHYGAPCYYAGRVWVPLEHGPGNAMGMGSVTTSLTSPVVQVMPEAGGSSPWCATHNGVLYTSQNAGGTVRRYRIQGTSLVRIADLVLKNHEYESPVSLTAIAGGAISDSGETLFLTSDSLSLIAAFDLPTGGLRTLVLIPPIQGWPVPNTVEIEGITYWNDPPSPGIDGQLHVVTLLIQDVPPDEDNFAFRHFAVANPADLGRL